MDNIFSPKKKVPKKKEARLATLSATPYTGNIICFRLAWERNFQPKPHEALAWSSLCRSICLKGHTHQAILVWSMVESAAEGRFYRRFYQWSPCGYGLFIEQLGNWLPGGCRVTAVAGRWETADFYQACLIFHRQLIARRRPSPSNQSPKERAT